MGQIINAINDVAQQFPEVRGITVTTGDVSVAYAVTDGDDGTITINHRYVSDDHTMRDMIDRDVAIHWHPPLGHCTGPQSLAYHESAHVIDLRRGNVADTALAQRFGDGAQLRNVLSDYSFKGDGTIFPAEALAEAFTAVRCNGGNWAEQALYHILVG